MSYQSLVYNVIVVPIEKAKPNTYNPNKAAPPERRLLYGSIKENGYTMPVVCYYAKAQGLYLIVDGFHRHQVMPDYPDIYEREQGLLPVSVIDKPIGKWTASTIRHNRARDTHNMDLTSSIVKELHELGCSNAWIPRHLGVDRDEILRLRQIIRLATLFRDAKLGQAWRPVEDDQDWDDGR